MAFGATFRPDAGVENELPCIQQKQCTGPSDDVQEVAADAADGSRYKTSRRFEERAHWAAGSGHCRTPRTRCRCKNEKGRVLSVATRSAGRDVTFVFTLVAGQPLSHCLPSRLSSSLPTHPASKPSPTCSSRTLSLTMLRNGANLLLPKPQEPLHLCFQIPLPLPTSSASSSCRVRLLHCPAMRLLATRLLTGQLNLQVRGVPPVFLL